MAESLRSNIPVPDPSVIANERLAEAVKQLRAEMTAQRGEAQHWVNSLQLLLEAATASLDRVVQTRLAGNDTALTAAMNAADKVVAKIEVNFNAVMTETKVATASQFKSVNDKIDDLKERMSEAGGRSTGTSHMATLIVAIVAAAAAVFSIAMNFSKSDRQLPAAPPISLRAP